MTDDQTPRTWPSDPTVSMNPVTGGEVKVEALVVPQATSNNAIVALVLAISAWVVFPVSIVFSIIAVVFASMASKEIKASGGMLAGQGMVTASRIVSWINIGLWIAVAAFGLIFLVIVLLAGAASV